MGTMRIRYVSFVVWLGLAPLLAGAVHAQAAADTTRVESADLRAVQPWLSGVLAPDKLQHFSLAFSLGLAFGVMTAEPAAAGGAAVLALGKEVADSRHGRFDGMDLTAGLIGAGCAALLIAYLER